MRALGLLLAGCLVCQAQQPMDECQFRKYVEQRDRERGRLWRQKQYEKAVAILEELRGHPMLSRLEDRRIGVLYDLACGYSLLGQKEKAVAYLREALAAGMGNYPHIRRDTDLDNIRQEAGYEEVAEALRNKWVAESTFWESPAWSTPYRENLGDEEKVAGLSKFWSEARYNFAWFERLPSLDWDALYLAYLPKVRQTKSTLEYYRVLQEFCAQLRDAHSYIYRPRELSEELESKPLLKTRFVEGKVLIVSVLDESLKREGFQPGLEITALDGIAVRQYGEQRVARYVSASTRQWLDVQTYEERLLAGPKNAPVELTLLDSGGKAFNRTVPRKSPQEAAGYEEKPKLLELRPLAGNVAYVALNTFADQKLMKEFDSSFEAIQPSDALILDVRANVGGSSGIGWYVLSYLTDKPFLTFQTRERVYRPYARAAGREQRWDTGGPYEQSQHGSKFYRKPVVVLTSARTFSAAEDFAVAFVAMKRGKIIGEATGGSTGQPLSFPLPGGGRGAVCTIQDRHADGSDFVGVGVKPDIEVHPTVADVRAGRDTVLEVALQYLRKLPRE